MPSCAQCHTSDTPCWREGPNGARTLCNACGIRWKRLMGRSKRPSKRGTPKSKAKPKAKPKRSEPVLKVQTPVSPPPPDKAVIEPSIQKPPPQQHPLVARTTRSSTRTTRSLLDNSTLASKNVLTMSQNELLDCILTRLEDLESSQTRTSLRVRVLTQRLMRQKQKQKLAGIQPNRRKSLQFVSPENTFAPMVKRSNLASNDDDNFESNIPTEGENEAFLLVSMSDITQVPASGPLDTYHNHSLSTLV